MQDSRTPGVFILRYSTVVTFTNFYSSADRTTLLIVLTRVFFLLWVVRLETRRLDFLNPFLRILSFNFI